MVVDNTGAAAESKRGGYIAFFLLLKEMSGIILMPNENADTDFK